MQNFISRLVHLAIKLVLAAFGVVFAVSLLFAALLVIAFGMLKWLVTGKKPVPVMIFNKFQKFSPNGIWPTAAKPQNTTDVVDVEVREVKPGQPQLKDDKL